MPPKRVPKPKKRRARRDRVHKFDKTARMRAVCITLNNPTAAELKVYDTFAVRAGGPCSFFIGQKERGPDGTVHLQCYAYSGVGRTFSAWKQIMGSRAHIERAKAGPKDNIAYCSKVDTRVEGVDGWAHKAGTPPTQGKVNLTEAMADVLVLNDAEMMEKHTTTWTMNMRALKNYRNDKAAPREFKTAAIWLHGETGTNKSTRGLVMLKSLCKDWGVMMPGTNVKTVWGDGCNGKEGVLIDDLAPGNLSISTVMRMVGNEPYRIPEKGGSYLWRPKVVVITSNWSPSEMFEGAKQLPALLRRLRVEKFVKDPNFKIEKPGVDVFDSFFEDDNAAKAGPSVRRELQDMTLVEIDSSGDESDEGIAARAPLTRRASLMSPAYRGAVEDDFPDAQPVDLSNDWDEYLLRPLERPGYVYPGACPLD